MFVAINLLVILEHTMARASAHEVIIALTGSEAATHCGTRLVATFTSLKGKVFDHTIKNRTEDLGEWENTQFDHNKLKCDFQQTA